MEVTQLYKLPAREMQKIIIGFLPLKKPYSFSQGSFLRSWKKPYPFIVILLFMSTNYFFVKKIYL
jgi:hypothetical protein